MMCVLEAIGYILIGALITNIAWLIIKKGE